MTDDWWVLWDAHVSGDGVAFDALVGRVDGAGPMLRRSPELPSFARACGDAWGLTPRSTRWLVHNWMGVLSKVRRPVVHWQFGDWIVCSGAEVNTTSWATTRAVSRVSCGLCRRTVIYKRNC